MSILIHQNRSAVVNIISFLLHMKGLESVNWKTYNGNLLITLRTVDWNHTFSFLFNGNWGEVIIYHNNGVYIHHASIALKHIKFIEEFITSYTDERFSRKLDTLYVMDDDEIHEKLACDGLGHIADSFIDIINEHNINVTYYLRELLSGYNLNTQMVSKDWNINYKIILNKSNNYNIVENSLGNLLWVSEMFPISSFIENVSKFLDKRHSLSLHAPSGNNVELLDEIKRHWSLYP